MIFLIFTLLIYRTQDLNAGLFRWVPLLLSPWRLLGLVLILHLFFGNCFVVR